MAGKVMRSRKEGSLCAEQVCKKPISIGDPIIYFGSTFVFGLTCHRNEKTEKHLRKLLIEEGGHQSEELLTEEIERLYTDKSAPTTALPPREPKQPVSAAQEWVCRVDLNKMMEGPAIDAMPQAPPMFEILTKLRYGTQILGQPYFELRAPRSVSTQMTQTWANSVVKHFPEGCAEAVPLWVG